MNDIEEEIDFSDFSSKKTDPIHQSSESAIMVEEPSNVIAKSQKKKFLYIGVIIIMTAATVFIFLYFRPTSKAPVLPAGQLPANLQKPGMPTLPAVKK